MPGPYDQIIADAEQKYRLPRGLLASLIKHESANAANPFGDPRALSPAGARGLAQLMPDTARSLGVTDPYDPSQSINAGARYLADQLGRFHTPALALAAYNAGPGNVAKYGGVPPFAETRAYVRNVLADARATMPTVASGGSPAAQPSALPAREEAVPALPTRGASAPPLLSPELLSLLNANNRLLGLPTLNLPASPPPTTPTRPVRRPPTAAKAAAAPPETYAQEQGHVTLAPNADRPGVHIHPQVVQFVGDIAALYGKPLVIGTGTRHNEYVKDTHRESAHWTGWAADVPAEGDALTKIGFSALLAAGMDPRRAKTAAARGGLFNVNGYQIIFKSNIGGNHWNHLHVGFAPSKQKP